MLLSQKIIQDTDKSSAGNYKRYPVALVKGDGVWVWDAEGNRYLDMLSAYSAVNMGHSHPRIVAAIKRQAENLCVISGNFYNDKHAILVKQLTELCGKERVLLSSGGVESVETALKIARKWGFLKKGTPDCPEILVSDKNFHGRTITAISCSPVAKYQYGFGPITSGFRAIPFGDSEALERSIDENTIAFLVEPIAGEGGVHVPPLGYLMEAERICRKHNILLILDEIQTGFGRTGADFAFQHEFVNPDILILGKSLGGGLPVSAVLADSNIMDVIGPGDHGSTFGGNPICCAAAIESLKILKEEKLSEKAVQAGFYLRQGLKNIKSPYIKEVRGKGLFLGVELTDDSCGPRLLCEDLAREGVLTTYARDNVVRFTPPLIINKQELDWGLERIKKVFCEGGAR